MQIHLSDISSSEGMRIQKTAEFGMDTITFQSGSFPVLAKEPIELIHSLHLSFIRCMMDRAKGVAEGSVWLLPVMNLTHS